MNQMVRIRNIKQLIAINTFNQLLESTQLRQRDRQKKQKKISQVKLSGTENSKDITSAMNSRIEETKENILQNSQSSTASGAEDGKEA